MSAGSFMLLNIFIAILLTNMSEPEDQRLRDLESLIPWAQHEHSISIKEREDEIKFQCLANLWEKRRTAAFVKARRPYRTHRDRKRALGSSLGNVNF